MLHSIKDLRGDRIVARDGEVGAVEDVYFDNERWGVRYLAVDVDVPDGGRYVLIPPSSIDRERSSERAICVDLTREQLKRCPDTGDGRYLPRSYEMALARYYGFPYYWVGPQLWGPASRPVDARAARGAGRSATLEMQEHAEATDDEASRSHLRSGGDVVGYRLEASDGALGHIIDVLFDDETWSVAHLVVDTADWLPGRKILVSPGAIEDVDPVHRTVRVRASREEVQQAPEAIGR